MPGDSWSSSGKENEGQVTFFPTTKNFCVRRGSPDHGALHVRSAHGTGKRGLAHGPGRSRESRARASGPGACPLFSRTVPFSRAQPKRESHESADPRWSTALRRNQLSLAGPAEAGIPTPDSMSSRRDCGLGRCSRQWSENPHPTKVPTKPALPGWPWPGPAGLRPTAPPCRQPGQGQPGVTPRPPD